MRILDACCGSRRFWFDKEHPDTEYMDIREEVGMVYNKKINVVPDIIGDFRNMPFKDNTYDLIVFDPPHCKWAGENSITAKQYGVLDKDNWPDDIKSGMAECMRVLKPNGTIIFKWNECQIKLKDLLIAIEPFTPMFGNKRSKTHWLVFNKQIKQEPTSLADEVSH